ncbi:MAG: hypothetical protein L0241_00955, partial [Planctomycetia bacterium]|nr:hypothetical protein [Planctomycetia bacterium]
MLRWAVAIVACFGVALPSSAQGIEPPQSRTALNWTEPAENWLPIPPATPHTPTSSNPLAERLELVQKVELRGRIEADAVIVSQSTSSKALIGDIQNGYGFRRARLGAQGTVGTSSRWIAEIDFANGLFRARDLFVGLTALPGVDELKVGFFREPFSLDGATSSRFITFLERSPLNELDPARNWGVAGNWWSASQRAHFAIGAFRDGTNNSGFSGGDGGNWAVTTRLTGLPVFVEEEGTFRLVHIGGAFSNRRPFNGVVQYAPAPQTNILDVSDSPASPFLPRMNIPANSQQLYNLQAAAVFGSLSFQGEWFGTAIQQKGAGVVFLHGFYVETSYFLTGEHRGYDKKEASFSRVSVRRPLVRTAGEPSTGLGAIELALRFSVADFASPNLPPPPTSGPFALAPTGAVLYQPTFGV